MGARHRGARTAGTHACNIAAVISATSPADLLKAWERGLTQPPALRALTLLGAAYVDSAADELASMSIGERDRLLLDLREQTFGASLNATTRCPACGEMLEMNFDVSEVRVGGPPKAGIPFAFNRNNYSISFRIPNSLDAAALEPQADISQNRKHLLRRCVLRSTLDAKDISAEELPDDIVEEIAAQMAEADPQSDI